MLRFIKFSAMHRFCCEQEAVENLLAVLGVTASGEAALSTGNLADGDLVSIAQKISESARDYVTDGRCHRREVLHCCHERTFRGWCSGWSCRRRAHPSGRSGGSAQTSILSNLVRVPLKIATRSSSLNPGTARIRSKGVRFHRAG